MGTYVLDDCKLYVAEFDLSGDMNQMRLNAQAQEKPHTHFGNTWENYLSGNKSGQFSHHGFWNGDDGNVDDVLWSKLAVENAVVTIGPTDGSDGEHAYFMKTLQTSYAPGEAAGEVFAFDVEGRGSDIAVRGTVMLNTTVTATGTGTVRELGAVSSSQSVYAALHVLSFTGTSLDVKVQSDDAQGFASPTDRITFTQATDVTSEMKSAAGAITDTWWAVDYTVVGASPSIQFLVTVGIQ